MSGFGSGRGRAPLGSFLQNLVAWLLRSQLEVDDGVELRERSDQAKNKWGARHHIMKACLKAKTVGRLVFTSSAGTVNVEEHQNPTGAMLNFAALSK
ncbi:unnamed protein product [Prunus armeniaca]